MCFFFGGLKYHEQHFNNTMAGMMSSLMAVSTSSLIIPAALYASMPEPDFDLILSLSRGTSIVILVLYFMYLYFQLKTHRELYATAQDENTVAVLTPREAGAVLFVVTIMVSVCAEYLVGSIEGVVGSSGISKTFIGLILIPIVGNAAEHVTAIVVALKNKVRQAQMYR
jgi:Ca2+:H+ antiporter